MPCTRSLSQAHRHRLTPAPLCGILLFIGWGMAALSNALRITSAGPQTVHVAENDEVQIGCIYRLDSTDTGSLDIEWSIVSPDTTKQDRMILTYVHEQVFDYPNPLLGRFEFSESDPSAGNASVRIRALQTSDTNTFQCKVKKAPGIDTRKVTVRVHGRPQDPECWMDRSGDRGQDVRLHCVSHSGSPPLTYSWDRISSNSQELPAHSIADRVSGTLVIRNCSAQWDGTYRCSVRNLVGQAECQLLISAAPAAG
ncbi:coxsackievirus and adenovirus receptor homolog [Carcharodon carcharias]|uniref:coxsackievirus and adenovirus receptor homolog n=1 Tax=Carcharodon carcharias TaxID=13397 RepID=UPI001B7F4252|nr:coxsackievirus and adenovirus receptor homolog [Carcharodon carcharias]